MVKLTESIIATRLKTNSFHNMKKLNVWGCDIDDISILANFPSLQILSLSVNKITSLKPLANLYNLKELFLRKNEISDINEVDYLRDLVKLRVLWLDDNPCAYEPNYRQYVISVCPGLTTLDNRFVTKEELAQAAPDYEPPAPTPPPSLNNQQQQQSQPDTQRSGYSNSSDLENSSSHLNNQQQQHTPNHQQHPVRHSRSSSKSGPEMIAGMGEVVYYAPAQSSLPHSMSQSFHAGISAPQQQQPQQQQNIYHPTPPQQASVHEGMLLSQSVGLPAGGGRIQYTTGIPDPGTGTVIMTAAGGVAGIPTMNNMSMTGSYHPSMASNNPIAALLQQPQPVSAGINPTQFIVDHNNLSQSSTSNNLMSQSMYATMPLSSTVNNSVYPNNSSITPTQSQQHLLQNNDDAWTNFDESNEESDQPTVLVDSFSSRLGVRRSLNSQRRMNRSRSVSPNRMQRQENVLTAILHLMDDLDLEGLRVVIDQAHERIKKQR